MVLAKPIVQPSCEASSQSTGLAGRKEAAALANKCPIQPGEGTLLDPSRTRILSFFTHTKEVNYVV